MATSGTTDFVLTVRDICHDALQENAIIPLGEEMEAEELSSVIRRLNGMLKSWQMKGLSWKHETISATVTADTATVTLPGYVRGVNGCRFLDSPNNEREMVRWERDEYYRLPNKAASGKSTAYYLNRAEDGLVLYVWPVPLSDSTLKVDIDRKVDTVTSANETLDVPEELMETVYANLALRCCGLFGIEPKPELAMRALALETEMLDNYRPASYFLGPM